jgi:hypothetical protein
MDVVITYVNGCEKVWRTSFNKYGTDPLQYMKFYDWGTLRYVLRGIATYMPYIKNVFLVVSNIEQIPDYVDQSKVKVVLHKDFIHEEFLPTFNACTIELFLHRIKELDEYFIYFNDDILPISPIAYNDLIYNGQICESFVESYSIPGQSSYGIIKQSFRGACLYVADKNTYSSQIIEDPLDYEGPGVCPVHGPTIFMKHKNEDIYDSLYDYLQHHISKEKRPNNISQHVYSDVLYLENNYIGSRLSLTYISSDGIKEEDWKQKILSANTNYLCINDLGPICGLTYKESSDIVKDLLNIRLPKVCKYEQSDK